MKNKYKENMSKYKINDAVKIRIDTILERPRRKKLQVVYGGILALLICLISVSIVYAEDIKEFIESWGKTKITFYKEDGTTEKIELSEIETIKTNLDQFVFDDETYAKLDIRDEFYPVPKEALTYFTNLNLEEIEKKLGVSILGLRNFKYNYTYTEITSDKKIGSIHIEMNEDYVVDCGVTNKCNPLGRKYKGLSLDAQIRTKNAQEKDYTLTEWGYAYSNEGRENPSIKKFTKIGNLDVEGISYVESVMNSDGTYEEFVTDMMFNYKNIRYDVTGWNLTHEEIIQILKDNLK